MSDKMTVDQAVNTINQLRNQPSLSDDEQKKLKVAWGVLQAHTAPIVYTAWVGDVMMGGGDTEDQAVATAVAMYEREVGYGNGPHQFPDKSALVGAIRVTVGVLW